MASPKRDQYKPGSGKLLKNDDTELDVSALLAKIDGITSAVTGLLVNATITTGDIEIGAVELKNASDDQRASIEAANVARTAATKVLAVQTVDEAGLVLGRDAANTARTTATKVNPTQNVDPAGTVAANITAGADGVSNTATRLGVSSWLKAFNGTTWDRVRSAVTTIGSTFTGFINTLGWTVFYTTPGTRTNGQGGPTLSDAVGNLLATLNTYIRGEDPVFNLLKVQTRGTYTVPLTASALVFTGPGQLMGFVVNSCAAGATLKIWDNTSAATTVAFDTMTFTAAVAQGPQVVMLPAAVQLNTGCYFTIAVAAMSVTPIWNQA